MTKLRTARQCLGVKPGESDPARMLAGVLVLVAFTLLTVAAAVATGWLWS